MSNKLPNLSGSTCCIAGFYHTTTWLLKVNNARYLLNRYFLNLIAGRTLRRSKRDRCTRRGFPFKEYRHYTSVSWLQRFGSWHWGVVQHLRRGSSRRSEVHIRFVSDIGLHCSLHVTASLGTGVFIIAPLLIYFPPPGLLNFFWSSFIWFSSSYCPYIAMFWF